MSRFETGRAALREFVQNPSPEGTISGFYPLRNDGKQIGAVVLHEFGSNPGLRPNQQIVDHYEGMDKSIRELPLFVSGSIAEILRTRNLKGPTFVFNGQSATNLGEGLGTFGELAQLYEQTRTGEIEGKILVISQAYNIPNILRQAALLRLPVATQKGYPTSFDMGSNQLWTKHWALWALSSRLRIAILRAKGH